MAPRHVQAAPPARTAVSVPTGPPGREPSFPVRAAFYYVAHDQTVRPADLLDEAGLAALIEQVPAEA